MVVAQLRLSNPHVFLSLPVWKTRPRLSRPHSILLLLRLFFFLPLFLPLPARLSSLSKLFLLPRVLCSFSPLFYLYQTRLSFLQGFPFAGASSSLRSLWCFRERFIRGRLRGSVEYTSALWFSRIYLGLMIVERKNTRYISLYAARREKFREWRGIGYPFEVVKLNVSRFKFIGFFFIDPISNVGNVDWKLLGL